MNTLASFYANNVQSNPSILKSITGEFLQDSSCGSHDSQLLSEFVRQSGETSNNFTEYCYFLSSLVNADTAAIIFNLAVNLSSKINLSNVFVSLITYANHLKTSINSYNPLEAMELEESEAEAIIMALKLTTICCRHSSYVRSCILETATWAFVPTFTTLVQCRIPLDLKAAIINVLSDVSLNNFVIQSNIYELLQAANAFGNILSEFDQIESDAGIFSVTTAYFNFLYQSLQQIGKNPGTKNINNHNEEISKIIYQTYVTRILIQLENKAFKNEKDRLELYQKILDSMTWILSNYDGSNLQCDSILSNSANRKTAQNILYNLLDPTHAVFKKMMELVENCTDKLYCMQPNQKNLKSVIQSALTLINCVAKKSNEIRNSSRNLANPPRINNFDKVLLSYNTETNKAEYLSNILNCLTFYTWLPKNQEIINLALQFFEWFSKNASGNNEKALIRSLNDRILYSFIEIVEDQDQGQNHDNNWSMIILKSLALALSNSSQSLGKKLAEIIIGLSPRNNSLTNPNPKTGRSIIHSCLKLVKTDSSAKIEIKEACYEILYRLSGSTRSGHITLKYLRHKNFIMSQLKEWDFTAYEADNHFHVKALSWILKMVALEAFVSHKAGANERLERLAQTVLNEDFLSATLQKCEIYYVKPEPPSDSSMKMFDLNSIQSLIEHCQEPYGPSGALPGTDFDCKLVNTDKLFKLIDSEIKPLASMQNLDKESKNNIEQELKILLDFIGEYNKNQTKMSGNFALINGLRQAIETIICLTDYLPNNYGSKPAVQENIDLIMIKTFITICNQTVETEIADNMGYKKMTLNHAVSQQLAGLGLSVISKLSSFIENASLNSITISSALAKSSISIENSIGQLFNWLNASSNKKKTKSYILSTILYFVKILENTGIHSDQSFKNNFEKAIQIHSENPTTLNNLVNDICDSHAITRSLSCNLLSQIITCDHEGSSLIFLTKNGYLSSLVAAFANLDEQIVKSLYEGVMEKEYPVLISLCKLFDAIATHRGFQGCRILVDANLIDAIVSMKYLQNCVTISEYQLYKDYASPPLKTAAAIITGLTSNGAGPNSALNGNAMNLGAPNRNLNNNCVTLNRVKTLFSEFIEQNCDLVVEFLKKCQDQQDRRLQHYLLQIIHCGLFTNFSINEEINSNLWTTHSRIMPKIFDLLRDSTILDDESGIEKAWILLNYSKSLVFSQLNSCKDLSIHWDMIKSNSHQVNLKLFCGLVEPLSIKLESIKKKMAKNKNYLANKDDLSAMTLKNILGEAVDVNDDSNKENDPNSVVANHVQSLSNNSNSNEKNISELRILATSKLQSIIQENAIRMNLLENCIDMNLLITFKTIQWYTQPVINAKKNFQTYGNQHEISQMIGQIKTIFTEGYFKNLRKSIGQDGGQFLEAEIREIQHLMVQLPSC